MKQFLLTAMIAATTLGAFAETAFLDFTYADGRLMTYGKGKREIVDVAMCINDPGLAGMKLKSFQAYVNVTENISETSVWLSRELTLENDVNVPDIASFSVTPVPALYGDMEIAVMSVELAEPYVLDENPLYLGYSLTVDDLIDDTQRHPIILANNVNPNGLWVRLSRSVIKWKEYSSTAGGSALIIAQLEGDLPSNYLGINGVEQQYAGINQGFEIEYTVSNLGANPINSVSYSYTTDGANPTEGTVELPVAINPSFTKTATLWLPVNSIDEIGTHTVDLTITKVNGSTNEAPDASASSQVNVVSFVPVHRPLVEEFTALWCGWCTRGYIAMEAIKEYYDDYSVSICYHNGDPMTVTYDYPVEPSGYPSATINRIGTMDPYFGATGGNLGILEDVKAVMNSLTIAAIEVEATLDESEISVSSTTSFIQDIDNANYEVGYVLVSNGLTDPEWAQSNTYSSYKGSYNGTPLEEATNWPSPVYGLVFNDVAIDVNGMTGVSGSLPSEIKLGEEYKHSYSYDITDNPLVQNPENLVVATYVIDKKDNSIVNANKCKVNLKGATGIDSLSKDAKVVETEYFDLTGRRVAKAANGIFIKVEKLNDGTTRTSKVTYR